MPRLKNCDLLMPFSPHHWSTTCNNLVGNEMLLTLFRFEIPSAIDRWNSFSVISLSGIGIYILQCPECVHVHHLVDERKLVFWQLMSCFSHPFVLAGHALMVPKDSELERFSTRQSSKIGRIQEKGTLQTRAFQLEGLQPVHRPHSSSWSFRMMVFFSSVCGTGRT
jgi:hypothetical protein